MDRQYAIFDMDGTLVDSMGYWDRLSLEYLEGKGVTFVPQELLERIKPMTMTESAALFLREFGLPGTPEDAGGEMNAMMEQHYRRDIHLKDGAGAYLQMLKDRGVRMCVASATAQSLVEGCLRRLGVEEYFDFILSCEEVGAGKNRPDVYLAAAQRLGATPGQIAVYEDAIYAAKTAKAAGFHVVAVYDDHSAARWEEMAALADEKITDWAATI